MRVIKLSQRHYDVSFDLFDQLKNLIEKRGFRIEYADFDYGDIDGCIIGQQIFLKNSILDINVKIAVLSHEIGHWMVRGKDKEIKQYYQGFKRFNLVIPVGTIKSTKKCRINYDVELAAQMAGERLVKFLIRRRM